MTSIRKTIKKAKKKMNAKSITINFLDKNGDTVKLCSHDNKVKRQRLAMYLNQLMKII